MPFLIRLLLGLLPGELNGKRIANETISFRSDTYPCKSSQMPEILEILRCLFYVGRIAMLAPATHGYHLRIAHPYQRRAAPAHVLQLHSGPQVD